jgi:hypothetical protein
VSGVDTQTSSEEEEEESDDELCDGTKTPVPKWEVLVLATNKAV